MPYQGYKSEISTPDIFVLSEEAQTVQIAPTTSSQTVQLVGPGNAVRVVVVTASMDAIPTVIFEFGGASITTSATLPNNVYVLGGMDPVGYFKRQSGDTHVAVILPTAALNSLVTFTPCYMND